MWNQLSFSLFPLAGATKGEGDDYIYIPFYYILHIIILYIVYAKYKIIIIINQIEIPSIQKQKIYDVCYVLKFIEITLIPL